MTGRDPLGDRMKQYEAVTRLVLPRRTYTVVRVDGKAFHTFLAHVSRPWDYDVVQCMKVTAQRVAQETAGTVLAYGQSDEISFVLQDFESNGTQPHFGGVVQKITSVTAALTSVVFAREYAHYFDVEDDDPLPVFDARVFTIPEVVEVANYLMWRQRDCARNSVLALAQSVFSHRELQGEGVRGLVQRLKIERGLDWEVDIPDGLRRGWLTTKIEEPGPDDSVRTRWVTEAAFEFAAGSENPLATLLPGPRTLT